MFLVNSRFSLVSATLNPRKPKNGFIKYQAPLLPKLRGHFAEFLNHDYLVRLGILCPTTCVGLGYGRPATSRRSFSRHHRITPTSHPKVVIIPPHIKPPGFTWAVSYTVKRGIPSPREGFHCASLHTLAYQESLSPNQNHNQTPKRRLAMFLAWVSTFQSTLDGHQPVPEYQPVIHRLRLSASP